MIIRNLKKNCDKNLFSKFYYSKMTLLHCLQWVSKLIWPRQNLLLSSYWVHVNVMHSNILIAKMPHGVFLLTKTASRVVKPITRCLYLFDEKQNNDFNVQWSDELLNTELYVQYQESTKSMGRNSYVYNYFINCNYKADKNFKIKKKKTLLDITTNDKCYCWLFIVIKNCNTVCSWWAP